MSSIDFLLLITVLESVVTVVLSALLVSKFDILSKQILEKAYKNEFEAG